MNMKAGGCGGEEEMKLREIFDRDRRGDVNHRDKEKRKNKK